MPTIPNPEAVSMLEAKLMQTVLQYGSFGLVVFLVMWVTLFVLPKMVKAATDVALKFADTCHQMEQESHDSHMKARSEYLTSLQAHDERHFHAMSKHNEELGRIRELLARKGNA